MLFYSSLRNIAVVSRTRAFAGYWAPQKATLPYRKRSREI